MRFRLSLDSSCSVSLKIEEQAGNMFLTVLVKGVGWSKWGRQNKDLKNGTTSELMAIWEAILEFPALQVVTRS